MTDALTDILASLALILMITIVGVIILALVFVVIALIVEGISQLVKDWGDDKREKRVNTPDKREGGRW